MVSYRHLDYGWKGRWVAWRNRLYASPRFQAFAARCWLTRPIARRRARGIFNLVAGFTYSQILAAVIATQLLDHLSEGPLTLGEVARRITMVEASALRLLRAAAALKLVEPLGADWALGSDGAALIGNGGIAEMVAHHHLLYADLADPVALLRRGGGGGALAGLWSYADSPDPEQAAAIAAYSALMAASQPLVARQALDAYDFSRHRRLLDVGGGEGVFASSVAARVPQIEVALFDLPAVAGRASARFASAGLADRATAHAGNFLTDSLPTGYDVISLVRVLHDHDDGPAMVLLRAIHAALPPGGTLFITEPMAGTPGAEASGDAYFGFYLLAMGSGRPRRPDEIRAMLAAAGFARSRLVATAVPLNARIILARR